MQGTGKGAKKRGTDLSLGKRVRVNEFQLLLAARFKENHTNATQ
jgi:hypothetical protein